MQALTGLAGFDWSLVGATALAVVLVLSSARKPAEELRRDGQLAPLLAGLALFAFLALRHHSQTLDALRAIPDRLASLAVAAGLVFVAIAVTDLLLRIGSAAARMLSRTPLGTRWTASLVLVLGLALEVAATVGVIEKLPAPEAASTVPENVSIRATYSLPGHPTDIVFRGARDGYVALAEGEIDRFELPRSPGGALELEPVVRMLQQPRGLAIIGRHLFVSELGRFPCPRGSLRCTWTDLPDLSPHAAELRILRTAKGRILRFEIGKAGGSPNDARSSPTYRS